MSAIIPSTLTTPTSAANSSVQSTAPAGATASSSSASSSKNGLASLGTNYQTFLKMLTTQLQNQDPTSPMDSSQFTSELVQFSSVEQQIQTNSSLTQLIQLTQENGVLQSSQLLGKQVEFTSPDLTLQQGSAAIHFTSPSAGPVAIAVYDQAGHPLLSTTVAAVQGANQWTWNGQDSTGLTRPDGGYAVGVAANGSDGVAQSLPFTVIGKATAVQQKGSTVQLQLGSLNVDLTAVVSVGK